MDGDLLEQQNRTARKLLMAALPLEPKSPREAYDTINGRAASDAEWAANGAALERNWSECVELYQIVSNAEQMLRDAYEKHLKS